MMEIQKVLHLHEAMKLKNPKVRGEYMGTEKMDGNYIYADYNATMGVWHPIKSSSHRALPCLQHLDFEVFGIQPKESCRIIMEATHPDHDFAGLNGLLKRHTRVDGLTFSAHDLVYFNNTQKAAKLRYKDLVEAIPNYMVKADTYLNTLPILVCSSNPNDWQRVFEKIVDAEGEGIVLKNVDASYFPGKRNESLLKIKEEVTLDLLVTDIRHTIGKKGEPSLSLICKRKSGLELPIVVPKDSDRIAWSANPQLIIGKVVEIKAMKELPDGKLREPRYKRERPDKLPTDIN